eukprot:TRINITY_DN38729_c0_g1_i1.p2 TRINITY_DN38729_c0_g1~~TRINITY_DN38729_c0_g1_i1.p2  ORF type:complete len:248 (-),score=6.80 TRINITY_DN38729_c0_g1_i1:352-1095(-)
MKQLLHCLGGLRLRGAVVVLVRDDLTAPHPPMIHYNSLTSVEKTVAQISDERGLLTLVHGHSKGVLECRWFPSGERTAVQLTTAQQQQGEEEDDRVPTLQTRPTLEKVPTALLSLRLGGPLGNTVTCTAYRCWAPLPPPPAQTLLHSAPEHTPPTLLFVVVVAAVAAGSELQENTVLQVVDSYHHGNTVPYTAYQILVVHHVSRMFHSAAHVSSPYFPTATLFLSPIHRPCLKRSLLCSGPPPLLGG